MTRRRVVWCVLGAAVLVTAALLIPAFLRATIVLRSYSPMSYPDGVQFHQDSGQMFRTMWWMTDDWDRPGLCPLTVHLPAGDLSPADLGSPDGLRRLGWEAKENGLGIDVTSPGRVVRCHPGGEGAGSV
jgi:hypothetical protein